MYGRVYNRERRLSAAVAAPPHESPPREGERGRVCCIECNKIGNAVRLLSFLDERDDRVVMNFSFFLFYTSFLSLFFFFQIFSRLRACFCQVSSFDGWGFDSIGELEQQQLQASYNG